MMNLIILVVQDEYMTCGFGWQPNKHIQWMVGILEISRNNLNIYNYIYIILTDGMSPVCMYVYDKNLQKQPKTQQQTKYINRQHFIK